MCGRATIITPAVDLEKRFNAAFIKSAALKENVNISAGNEIPVITSEQPNHIQLFRLYTSLGSQTDVHDQCAQ